MPPTPAAPRRARRLGRSRLRARNAWSSRIRLRATRQSRRFVGLPVCEPWFDAAFRARLLARRARRFVAPGAVQEGRQGGQHTVAAPVGTIPPSATRVEVAGQVPPVIDCVIDALTAPDP